MQKRSLLAITLILTVAGAVLWWNPFAGNAQNETTPVGHTLAETVTLPSASPDTESAFTVREEVFPRFLEVTGTVRPELESAVAPKISARVERVLVREGQRVKAGQVLVELDARDLDATIRQTDAGLHGAEVGRQNARVVVRMEAAMSVARTAEAEARLAQAEAALKEAQAHLQLTEAGLRPQERAQAVQAVAAIKANLDLAGVTLKRMTDLYQQGAVAKQQADQVQAQYDALKAQYEQALQAQSIADEGNRTEEKWAAVEAMRQAQAAVRAAQAGVKTAEASALQVEVRRQEVERATAQIGQAKASRDLARITRDFATITAPFSGVVAKRQADPGALVNPSVPLLTIQGGAFRLEAVVPESALPNVRIGATVPVRFDALGRNGNLTGRVVEVVPQGDATSHTFTVKVNVPRDSGVATGMFGRAQLLLPSKTYLVVPHSAVTEREGLHYVTVLDDKNTPHQRLIMPGVTGGDFVQVRSGLQAGERVRTQRGDGR